MSDQNSQQAFREAFQSSKHIVVIAGAGLSAGSGIPTFRDDGGMWRSLNVEELATPDAFKVNPSRVWQFYHYRRSKVLAAKKNPAHEVIAKMSLSSYLREVAPTAKTFHLVTQNIDRLSVTALQDLLTASSQDDSNNSSKKPTVFKNSILEMHGRIFDVKCTACGYCEEDRSESLCPALSAADASLADYQDAGTKEVDIPEEQLPRCPACGCLARPGVTWFGEKPLYLDEINSIVYQADMCLIIGTSSTVRPASTYAYRVQRHGGKVAIFNLKPSEKDKTADFVFSGPCEKVLPSIFPELAGGPDVPNASTA